MKNSQLRAEARKAAESGLKRFTPSISHRCSLHGGEHYTASGRCCECTKLAKSPAKQSAYWATVKNDINAQKRAKYREDKNHD